MAVRPARTRHRCFVARARRPRRCLDGWADARHLELVVLGDERTGALVPEPDLPGAGGLDRARAALFALAVVVGVGLTLDPAGLSIDALGRVGAAAAAAAAFGWLADPDEPRRPSPGRTLTRWLIGLEAAAFVALALGAAPVATGAAALGGLLVVELLRAAGRRQEAVDRRG